MRHRQTFSTTALLAYFTLLLAIGLGGCTVSMDSPVVAASYIATPTPFPTATPTAIPTATPTASPTPQASDVNTQTEGEAEIPERSDSEEEGDEQGTPASVTATRLNVRSGPGISYLRLGQLQNGDEVRVLERSEDGDWYRVCCLEDRTTAGWVAGSFLALDSVETELKTPIGEESTVPGIEDLAAGEIPDASQLWEYTVNLAFAHLPEQSFSYPPQSNINPLTGLEVTEERLGQRAVAVCIPSDLQARPQSGLSQADVVYEYLVDGELITRMTGIFFGESVPLIGPIRSARLINFYLGYMYNAGTMCSGASDYIRGLLRDMADFPFFDIDLDNTHGLLPYSFLVGNGLTRFHTSTDGIHSWLADTSREQPINLQGFEFGAPLEGGVPVSRLQIPFSATTSSNVEFRYFPETGQYLRYVGGAPHIDRNNDYQIAPQNIIVQYVTHATTFLVEDALGSRSLDHDVFGSGPAFIFRNGLMYEGTWHTGHLGQLVKFRTSDGRAIPLSPGRTWFALVPANYQLTTE